jgi:hypothetical protein
LNWNGKQKNGVLGDIQACRETIQATKQRGSMSDGEWLLEKVDPEENSAALISLVVPLTTWANSLPDVEKEKWLVWAITYHPHRIRQWLGYAEDWSMIPAACQGKEIVRLGPGGRLPSLYLLPAEPRSKEAGPVVLDNGLEMIGQRLATVTYIKWNGEWYKVFYPKLPSQSAVNRAIRLWVISVILARYVGSTNELWMYELVGIKNWLLYDVIGEGIAKHAGDTLFHLLREPEIASQLNG